MAQKKFNPEDLLDFVRATKLHEKVPVRTPQNISRTLNRKENSVRGILKGDWKDTEVLGATADMLIEAGRLGQNLRQLLDGFPITTDPALLVANQ